MLKVLPTDSEYAFEKTFPVFLQRNSPLCGALNPHISRLLYGELSYWLTVLLAYLGGTILVAAMTSLSSFATLKTLYIVWFDRVNDVSDAIIVKAIQGFTFLLTITMVCTEGAVKVKHLVVNQFNTFVLSTANTAFPQKLWF